MEVPCFSPDILDFIRLRESIGNKETSGRPKDLDNLTFLRQL